MRFSSLLACFLLSFLIGITINGQLFYQDTGLNSQKREVVSDGSDGGVVNDANPGSWTFNGTLRTIPQELCVSMGNVGDGFSISVVPASTVRSKLFWRHHMDSPATETFTARPMNLGDQDLLARFHVIIYRSDGYGCATFLGSQSFSLIPGVRTKVSFDYMPRGGPGRYCFVASLVYGVDANGNGVLDGYEPLGAARRHDGCFSYR